MLKRLIHTTDRDTVHIAYHSLVESHLRYALVVWGGTSKSNLNRVLICQKKKKRTMANLKQHETCRKAFIELEILTVVGLYIAQCIIHLDKTTTTKGLNIHRYETRNADKFVLPQHRLTKFESKPTYKGIKFYNLLPEDIRNAHPKEMKKRLITWLKKNPFYSIEEYITWQSSKRA